MTKPSFSYQISLGNLVQIATVLFAVGMGWNSLNAQTEANAKAASDASKTVRALTVRLRGIEIHSAADGQQLENIEQDVKENHRLLLQLIQRGSN